MALNDNNLSDQESLVWMAAGLIPMAIGLIIFVYNIYGVILGFVGALTFGCGYHMWSPIKAVRK